jgi:hypothetical protein
VRPVHRRRPGNPRQKAALSLGATCQQGSHMTADEARHERLIEIAAKAHCHSVAHNLARAVHSIH